MEESNALYYKGRAGCSGVRALLAEKRTTNSAPPTIWSALRYGAKCA